MGDAPLPAAPALVALDLGGVLYDIDQSAYVNASVSRFGVTPQQVVHATFESGLWAQVEVGAISAQTFLSGVLRGLGVTPAIDAQEALRLAWCRVLGLRQGALALTRRLRRPACAWSNTDPLHAAAIRAALVPTGGLAWVTCSYELGVAKPDPRYFQLALAQAGQPAGAVVFADDRGDNVDAAKILGVDAFTATSLAELERGLDQRGLLD